MIHPRQPVRPRVRRSSLPLLAVGALIMAGHGAMAQADPPADLPPCPAALQTPGAQYVGARALAELRAHHEGDPTAAFPTLQRNFGNYAQMNLPGTEFQDNKPLFTHIKRATLAACFPQIDALLTDVEQAPARQAQARKQAAADRQAAEQRAAEARQQAEADTAQREAEATDREQQQLTDANRALQADEEALGAKHQRQLLADQAERARAADEAAKRAAEAADRRAAEQQKLAEQQRQAAETAHRMEVEREQKQQAENEAQDRVEQAWSDKASTPRNALVVAYRNYIAVRQCAAAREGYEVVYVVPERLEQAKAEIRAVEAALLKLDPSIDKDAAWREANGPDQLPDPQADPTDQVLLQVGQAVVAAHKYDEQGEHYCDGAANVLDQLAKDVNPSGGVVKKDF